MRDSIFFYKSIASLRIMFVFRDLLGDTPAPPPPDAPTRLVLFSFSVRVWYAADPTLVIQPPDILHLQHAVDGSQFSTMQLDLSVRLFDQNISSVSLTTMSNPLLSPVSSSNVWDFENRFDSRVELDFHQTEDSVAMLDWNLYGSSQEMQDSSGSIRFSLFYRINIESLRFAQLRAISFAFPTDSKESYMFLLSNVNRWRPFLSELAPWRLLTDVSADASNQKYLHLCPTRVAFSSLMFRSSAFARHYALCSSGCMCEGVDYEFKVVASFPFEVTDTHVGSTVGVFAALVDPPYSVDLTVDDNTTCLTVGWLPAMSASNRLW
jgi:hypothetical protein